MTKIKVRIVDDSAVVRQVALEADSGIEVIAAVADPWFAIDRMKLNWPDVIVLDIEMPRMGNDGARGLREMHDAGASTAAEEESICVIFGMPKEAIKRGGVDKVVPPRLIPREIVAFSPIPVLR